MIGLIKADLRRIFRTKSFYIFNLFIVLVLALFIKTENAEEFISSAKTASTTIVEISVSFFVLVRVYSDELHAGTIQGAIGSGIKRSSIIKAKFLDCMAVVTVEMLTVLIVLFVFIGVDKELAITNQSRANLALSVAFDGIETLAVIALSSLVVYISWNVASMIIANICVTFVMPIVLTGIDQWLKTTLLEFWLDYLFRNSYTSFTAGTFDIRFILAIIVYIAVPVLLSAYVFKRKELEL